MSDEHELIATKLAEFEREHADHRHEELPINLTPTQGYFDVVCHDCEKAYRVWFG